MESEADGDALCVELELSVVLGVGAGVEELVPVGDPVGVCVGEGAAERLPDCEVLPVALGLAPKDSELVGEAVTVEDAEGVVDGVDKGEGVALDVGDPVDWWTLSAMV